MTRGLAYLAASMVSGIAVDLAITTAAAADPIVVTVTTTPPGLPGTPGATAPIATMAPGMMPAMLGGSPVNLHVEVRCAEHWANPERGLSVRVDGVPRPPDTTDAVVAASYGYSWTSRDVGYAIEPGHHHLAIAAPGCVALARDIEISPTMPTFVSGRLESDAATSSPVVAPDGGGFVLGAIARTRAAHAGHNELFTTDYTYDGTSVYGGVLSLLYERRVLVAAFDVSFAGGSLAGTASYKGTVDPDPTPVPFTGSLFAIGSTFRIGARFAIGMTSLAVGSGIGGDLVTINAKLGNTMSLAASPSDADVDWYVPLWSALTIKPWCNWGVQVMPSYEIHPTSTGENGLAVTAAVLWQPASACSEPAGIVVR